MIPDSVSEGKLKLVLPDLAIRWRLVREKMWDIYKRQIRVTDGLRTFGDQWECYSKGRLKDKNGTWIICDAKKVVTHAMPGQSLHNYGMALDVCFMGDDAYLVKDPEQVMLWNEYGKFCKDNSLVWGGDWVGMKNDRPHCEISYGLSIHALQVEYEDNGIKGVWNKCKLMSQCGAQLIDGEN